MGTNNYNAICEFWAITFLAASSEAFASAIANQAMGLADPTGVIGVVQAFNQPKCDDHMPIP